MVEIDIEKIRERKKEKKAVTLYLDPETVDKVRDNLGTFAMLTMKDQIEWYERLVKDEHRKYFIFTKEKKTEEDINVGYVRMMQIDYINRSVCVGGDIHKYYRGNGRSKEMYDLILDLVFDQMNMNKCYLWVLESNSRALHIYKKIGFKETGMAREAIWKNGRYVNYIYMDLLRKEYYDKSVK